MKHTYIIILFLSLIAFVAKAEAPIVPADPNVTTNEVLEETTVIPIEFTQAMDSMLQLWTNSKMVDPNCTIRPNPETSEAEFRQRLQSLPHLIEMPYNAAVMTFIELYTEKRRSQMEYLLGLSNYYFPIFEQELTKLNLPLELKYLPIIESSLNPSAVSRAGATGIWQFMLATGRMYGLEVNSLVDERRDPVKSSHVAAKYLKELHAIYSDWNLALAAYNCGPGNVNKAINRAGGKRDFWEIYNFLPAETRSYVPIFIAANYAMNYADEHHLCPVEMDMPILTDTILVNERIHFKQIADVLDYPIEKIRILNPQYIKEIIPGDIKPYPLILPQQQVSQYITRIEDIRSYQDATLIARRSEVEVDVKTTATAAKPAYKTHVVKKGQSLSVIARQYRTTVNNIKKTNGLKSNTIRVGQRLRIPS